MECYHTQVIPIRYASRTRLETGLREVLGNSNFIIEAFYSDQWTVKVPQMLNAAQIETLKSKVQRHYNKA
ncbi:hypothetical protein F4803DRAFT_544959 [Xylaria telfairii]|nr:hypothetical protein F4803DRAFT_544959 [Xylaria telfairii]